jgi:hypothetical protein
MEEKELDSMMKHRGLFLGLGLAALLGLSAREVSAAPMSLTVELNGTSIYSVGGSNTAVTANVGNLNTLLNGTGYSFSSLSGSSNYPGDTNPTVGGYVSNSGNLTFAPGGTGGTLTIIVNETGFQEPASGAGEVLVGAATANYSGAAAGSASPLTPTYQQFMGTFVDAVPSTVNTPTITQVANGTASDDHSGSASAPLPLYVTPYSLTNTTTINLTSAAPGNSSSNDVFTGKTSVVTMVPEPASLVMMVTGMPLPLVVMGLLRRRRAAA